ncbi:MAG: hypothetical protein Hals2KO_02510 [Halioglobus sp.]
MINNAISDSEFLDDLIDDRELAAILRVDYKSIPVMRCRGKLPIEQYRVGRKTLSSRRSAIEYIEAHKLQQA